MRLLSTFLISSAILFTLSSTALAEEKTHMTFKPHDIKWMDAPSGLPKGAQVAVLEGDPSKEGPFTMRLKVPGKYKIMPHTHPGVERVTVISGDFYLGFQDEFDMKKAEKLPVGSFALMQPNTTHFAFVHGPAIVQLNGTGPWGISYHHAKDDPRETHQ